jgi:hypothetical protein
MAHSLSKPISITAAAFAITMLAGATLPGAVTPAEAKKIFIVKHGHHGHHGHFGYRRYGYAPAYFVAGGYGGGCYWLKQRAHNTGSAYWWNRYNTCIG